MFSDDVGSLPLPVAVSLQRFIMDYFHAVEKIGQGLDITSDSTLNQFNQICREATRGKLETGLDVVAYPQIGPDMISQFLTPILVHSNPSNPYLIEEKYAIIPQLQRPRLGKN